MDSPPLSFFTLRPFVFLGVFGIPFAYVGNTASGCDVFVHDVQRAFYSGYLCCHGLKAQVVHLTIGIIGSVFITKLRQNDNGVQNMSGLDNYIMRLIAGIYSTENFKS